MDTRKPQTQECLFQETHHNSIIRVASYHRKDFELAVVRINPHDHERIHTSILQPTRAPAASLGRLDILPLEILHEICQLLDIESLFRFRQINLPAQGLDDAIWRYRVIISFAVEACCFRLPIQIES